MKNRKEHDILGVIEVSGEKYWGAQTQRSFENFKIGERMPLEVIHAFALLKKACAFANRDLGKLDANKASSIFLVCDEISKGILDDNFPLVVWQTGSGTQTNMNLNEVIANRAHVLNGGKLTDEVKSFHPNDDINKSQSSNDTFPTVMNIAAMLLVQNSLLPSLIKLKSEFEKKSEEFKDYIKVGRTHMMDATPISFGQEFSGYISQIDHGIKSLQNSLEHLYELAIGGTAVGTGLNAPKGFDKSVVSYINDFTGLEFTCAENKFEAMAANDAIVETHSSVKQLAVSLNKIANDLRLMSSGPRCGLSEIVLPTNEPGSSIMPGKVNPTQIEALTMVCAQVFGNDVAIATGAMNGQFELNVNKPLIIKNFIESVKLLSEAVNSFTDNCLVGMKVNSQQLDKNLENSLMSVAVLNEKIGYENAAKIAKYAFENDISLREAVQITALVSVEIFDNAVKPKNLI
jgi:fumarate hydratase class II